MSLDTNTNQYFIEKKQNESKTRKGNNFTIFQDLLKWKLYNIQ